MHLNLKISLFFLILMSAVLNAKSPDPEPIFIGVQVVPLDKKFIQEHEIKTLQGIRISEVFENSPASQSGLQKDWVILSVNGQVLTLKNGINDLKEALVTCRAQETSTWKVLDTSNSTHTIDLVPISRQAWSLKSTRSLAQKITQDVQKIRELEFKKDVNINVMNRQQLYQFLKDDYQREIIEADLKKGELLLSRLGIQPEGIDTVEITLELLKSGVLGFFHPTSKQLILIEGQTGQTAEASMAHELTHALQDQYFPLNFMLQQIQNNSDIGTALRCVTEGDAKLLELEYIKAIQNGNQDDLWLVEELVGGKHIPTHYDPKSRYFLMLEKELMFPYRMGTLFVKEAWKRGGWDRVNRLFDDWPKSTEQIIHPEKYFDKRDDPIELRSHDFIDWSDEKYEVVMSDVMGELNITRLFLNFVNREIVDAETAGAGWDGDRIIGLLNKKNKKPAIVWMSIWESEKDAKEFASGLTTLYQKRFSSDTQGRGEHVIAVEGDIVTILKQKGKKIIFCDGVPEAEARKLITKAIEGTETVYPKKNSFWESKN